MRTRPSDRSGDLGYRLLAACVAAIAAPFVRIRLERMDLARTENGIVVCNHRSMLDVVVGLVAFRRVGRYPRLAVATEYFARPGFGWALRLVHAVPVDRVRPADTVQRVSDVVCAGTPVLILAEGRLHVDPDDPTTTGAFKTGAARIAHATRLPVWPIALIGTDAVWPPDRRVPHLWPRRTVRILGAPELFHTRGDADTDTAHIRRVVTALLRELAGRPSSSREAG